MRVVSRHKNIFKRSSFYASIALFLLVGLGGSLVWKEARAKLRLSLNEIVLTHLHLDVSEFLFASVPKIVALEAYQQFKRGKLFSTENHLKIEVKVQHLNTLKADRLRAIEMGILTNPSFVPAVLTYQGQRYEARIRLKGDLADHWENERQWSLRVRLNDGKTIKRFNQFNISALSSRQFPFDHTFQYLGRETSELATQHDFATVFFNGERWGLKNLEEHSSKQLLEKQARKESPIIKLTAETAWIYREVNKDVEGKLENPYRQYPNPSVETKLYNQSKYSNDSYFMDLYSYAITKYAEARNNLIGVDEIFSTDSHYNALARGLVWNNFHALAFSNSKHYINPYTLKLEVLATDQGELHPIEGNSKWDVSPPFPYPFLLSLPNAFEKVSGKLDEVERALINLPIENKRLCELVLANCPTVDPEELRRRVKFVREHLSERIAKYAVPQPLEKQLEHKIDTSMPVPEGVYYPEHIYAEFFEGGRLRIYNHLPHNILLKSASFKCSKKKKKRDACKEVNFLVEPILLHPGDERLVASL